MLKPKPSLKPRPFSFMKSKMIFDTGFVTLRVAFLVAIAGHLMKKSIFVLMRKTMSFGLMLYVDMRLFVCTGQRSLLFAPATCMKSS